MFETTILFINLIDKKIDLKKFPLVIGRRDGEQRTTKHTPNMYRRIGSG